MDFGKLDEHSKINSQGTGLGLSICKKMIEKMDKCAKKIQMQWKVHRKRQFVNRIKNHVKIKSSIKI